MRSLTLTLPEESTPQSRTIHWFGHDLVVHKITLLRQKRTADLHVCTQRSSTIRWWSTTGLSTAQHTYLFYQRASQLSW